MKQSLNELETAHEWYTEDQIIHHMQRQKNCLIEKHERVPEDIYSPEFAKWITEQYRFAMMKGIQLERDNNCGINLLHNLINK